MFWLKMLMKHKIEKNIMMLKINEYLFNKTSIFNSFIAFKLDISKLLKVIAYHGILNVDLTATNETKITLVSFSGVCCE